MTVRELIDALSKQNPASEVFYEDAEWGFTIVQNVDAKDVGTGNKVPDVVLGL